MTKIKSKSILCVLWRNADYILRLSRGDEHKHVFNFYTRNFNTSAKGECTYIYTYTIYTLCLYIYTSWTPASRSWTHYLWICNVFKTDLSQFWNYFPTIVRYIHNQCKIAVYMTIISLIHDQNRCKVWLICLKNKKKCLLLLFNNNKKHFFV